MIQVTKINSHQCDNCGFDVAQCACVKLSPELIAEHRQIEGEMAKSPGMALVLLERQRQIEVEGWIHVSDDIYTNFELMKAAHCYARNSPEGWPWGKEWWKPSTDRKRDYAKAGALYLSERDRLKRAGKHRRAGLMQIKAEEMAEFIDELLGGTP